MKGPSLEDFAITDNLKLYNEQYCGVFINLIQRIVW